MLHLLWEDVMVPFPIEPGQESVGSGVCQRGVKNHGLEIEKAM